jgi:hypothetical protein
MRLGFCPWRFPWRNMMIRYNKAEGTGGLLLFISQKTPNKFLTKKFLNLFAFTERME